MPHGKRASMTRSQEARSSRRGETANVSRAQGEERRNRAFEKPSSPQPHPQQQQQPLDDLDDSAKFWQDFENTNISETIKKKEEKLKEIQEEIHPLQYKLPSTLPSTSMMELPVGGRLQAFVTQWEEMNADGYIVEVLRRGYKIPWLEKPSLSAEPLMESVSQNPLKDRLIQDQIEELLLKDVLEEVESPGDPGFYSILFMVPKPNGKWRPIIDLSRLNKHIDCPKFKMESVQSIWDYLLPKQYCFSLDLQDAYLHVPVHRRSRKYLRIFRRGKVYQFKALPFGLCTAPLIFTKVVSEVKVMVQNQMIQMCSFLDDWLHQVKSQELGLLRHITWFGCARVWVGS